MNQIQDRIETTPSLSEIENAKTSELQLNHIYCENTDEDSEIKKKHFNQ